MMKFIKSVKLTSGIIIYLIIFFIVSTFIPQGQYPVYYIEHYNKIYSSLILFLKLDNFNRSLFFIIPCLLFFINTLVCSIYRVINRITLRLPFMPGPDMIHIGIIIFMTGGFLSLLFKSEETVYLSKGGTMNVLEKYELILDDFIYREYPDGRPEKYQSFISIRKSGQLLRKAVLEVNKPFKIENYVFYQQSFKLSGDAIDISQINNNILRYQSGIKIVYDPGTSLVLLSFIVMFTGLMITVIQKKRRV
jgi:cytochrome c biogenesis protein ResB